jgi:hypothetical protein
MHPFGFINSVPAGNFFWRQRICIGAWLVVIFAGGIFIVRAQTNMPTILVASAQDDREKTTLEKHIKPILQALNLKEAGQEAKVREILATHLKALNAWHDQNDPQIKALWIEFNKDRSRRDQPTADAVVGKSDAVYASFKPQHDQFIAELSSVLTPAQIEIVKDVLTINKVKITFHAYGEIFPGLTEEQKAFIMKNLKAAREEAIDAGTMPEKSAFFKKYKIRIEAYLTSQGYDVKQAYKTFVAQQKAQRGANQSPASAAKEPQP